MKKFAILLGVMLCSCAPPHSEVKAIVGAKMGPWEHSVVLIEQGKITAAGAQQDIPIPKGAEIVGGVGASIDPEVHPGDPATLVLKGTAERTLRDGKWLN